MSHLDNLKFKKTGTAVKPQPYKAIVGARQKAQLRRMVDFKFTRHPSLNLPEERLTAIEKQLGERTRELLSIPVQRSAKRKNEPER